MAGTVNYRETLEDTIFSGRAVCAGYAGVYKAIALRGGLNCIMVTGHGKGFGHNPTKDGAPTPPRNATGHAWNAVQIDGGEWKLIDPCWGAGHIDPEKYTKKFDPSMFVMSNEDFGLKHFPEDNDHFYRKDRRIVSWEEYILGPGKGEMATFFSDGADEGVSPTVFQPYEKKISVHGGEE